MYIFPQINERIIQILNYTYHLTCNTFARDECDMHAKRDLITIYQNRHQKYNQLSLEQFFYQVFIQSAFNKKTKDNSNITNDDNHEQEVVASNQH